MLGAISSEECLPIEITALGSLYVVCHCLGGMRFYRTATVSLLPLLEYIGYHFSSSKPCVGLTVRRLGQDLIVVSSYSHISYRSYSPPIELIPSRLTQPVILLRLVK